MQAAVVLTGQDPWPAHCVYHGSSGPGMARTSDTHSHGIWLAAAGGRPGEGRAAPGEYFAGTLPRCLSSGRWSI